MTRLFALVLICLATAANMQITKAQNVQLLYDTGRNCMTSTVEMFRPDSLGSTYFFVDMDYSPKVSGAYWEISRELCFWKDTPVSWLSVHIEYNGGMNSFFNTNRHCAAVWHNSGLILHPKSWESSAFLITFAFAVGIVPPALTIKKIHLWLKK